MRDLTDKPPAPTPIVTQELLEYLLERYPDRVPNVDETDRQIWQSVIILIVIPIANAFPSRIFYK